MNVNVILFDDFETMDAFGPVELLESFPSIFMCGIFLFPVI